MDISNWIANSADSAPSSAAIRFDEQIVRYADMETQVSRLAGGLADELGVRPGDRVAFLGRNAPEILQILFACARLGAVFVPLNNRMTVRQLAVFLNHFQPRCMLADTHFGATAAQVLEGFSGIPLVTYTGAARPQPGGRTLHALFNGARPRSPDNALPGDSPALLVYTSGTTGIPKGVLLTHDNFTYGAMNSIRAYDMSSLDEVLTFIPMSHVGGLGIQTLPAMRAGATVTIHLDFDPGAVLQEIERSKITLFVARPMASKAIAAHPDWEKTDLSSLRAVNSGSTHVPLHTMYPWFKRGVPVQQNYGMTEALPPALIVPMEDALQRIGSVGKPALHCQVRIVDEWMRDVPTGERGQILLKGGSVFDGYWNNPQANAEAFHDGWFLTGDVGHVDADGYYFIDGRIKDIIIVGSSNVYPEDIERILSECDAIEEAAVVGRSDPTTGEAIVACVVPGKQHPMTAEEVRGLFEGRLAPYQIPQDIVFMDAIPHNLSGKIHRGELRQIVAG